MSMEFEDEFDLAAEVADVESRLQQIRVELAKQLGAYSLEGVTGPEAEELEGIRDVLGRIRDDSEEQARIINVGALPVRETFVAPDPTIPEDQQFAIADRFVRSRVGTPFTKQELEERLVKNGVVLPKNVQKRDELLETWLFDALDALEQDGEKIKRVDYTQNGQRLIAFAPIARQSETVRLPTPIQAISKVAARKMAAPKPASKPLKVETRIRPSEQDKQQAMTILTVLSQQTDMNKYLKKADIAEAAKLLGPEDEEFNKAIMRHARQLDTQKLVTYVTNRRKDQKPGVRLASGKVKEMMMTKEGRQDIMDLLDSGKPFKSSSP